jgi:hypothetical protein
MQLLHSAAQYIPVSSLLQDHLSTRVTLLEGRQAELAQQLEAAAASNAALTATNVALKQAAQEQVRGCRCTEVAVGGSFWCCKFAAYCMSVAERRHASSGASTCDHHVRS